MTIDPLQTDSLELSQPSSWMRRSHRSWAEQLVGLAIFILISGGVDFIYKSLFSLSIQSGWFQSLAPWTVQYWPSASYGTISLIFLGLSIWGLWRVHSLKQLKLELSLILSIFGMICFWCFSFFQMNEALLAMVTLLLTWTAVILSALLFWRKDRFASQLLVVPFCWILYLASLTMIICTAGLT